MASCNANSDPYRPPRDKFKECCEKQQVEKGNKYGADELKVYIKKQKEIRKYRELQEFEERERLLESKKQRLRELDMKCKQIASKNQFPPFPVPQSQQVQCQSQHNQQSNPAASQLYQQQKPPPPPPRERDVRDRDIFPQKFASQTVTSTNTKNNLPPISDRDRNSLGHALSGKPKLKRTKYTNQDFSSSQASGNKGQEREPVLVTTEAKRSKSNCKLERQAANFIFKEFENIVRRECKNLLRTRSSQFQSLSGESSTSIGSNSNSKSEVNLHFRDRTRDRDRNRNRDGDRDRDRDRDRDSSNSQSSSRDNKERKSRSSKSHPDKFIIGHINTATQPTQSTSATNTHFNNFTTQTNHSRIEHRDQHRVEQRERTVTKVDKNVGTSFTLYDSIDRREREMNSSDCCSSVDMDDSRSHLSDVNRLASSKGFHSLFQSNNKTKTQHNQQRKSLPPYVIPRPDDHPQLKRERVQQRIPEGVKHAAAAKIQAAYKSYKIRSILSEAKLRPRTSQSSQNYLASELMYRHTNGNGNPPPNHSVNNHKHHNTHHPMSPTIEFSSGDSRHNIKKSSQIHFYKSNQNQKLQPPAVPSPSPSPLHQQPAPEKPYDERSQRRMSARFNVPGGPTISIPRPSQQHSPAEGPVKPNPEDIPGYIPPPAGYGYSPIPRAPSYSPRTLPLLRLRHLDEPFPKQALDNLEFGSSQHSLNGQPSACQSPVKLISSISKFQMPHSLQVQQSASHHGQAHGHGVQQQQVPLSSPPGPIPVTYIPKPSSHPPSFLVEAKNKRVIPQSRLASLSSGQQKQQQNLYAEISSRIPGPGIQFKNQSLKMPEQSSAAFGSGTGAGAGPPPVDFKLMQSQFKKSMTTPALVDLPDPGFTTVLQEKIRLLRSNNIDNAGISRIMQIHSQNQSNQNRINILGPGYGPGTSSAGVATSSTVAGVGTAATMNLSTNALKSPIRRSQMTAVSKATEQIKKKIVEAKQILEDYKMELLKTNSSSNMSQLHQGESRVRDSDIEADLTYESDFDVDSQSRSISQLLQQDQQSLCGHDSDILQSHSQSLEADVQLSQIIAAKTKERDQRRLERERQKEAVALRYTIPRPSSITGSRSTSRSSRENVNVHDREMRTKTKVSEPPSAEHSASSDFQEIPAPPRSKSHSSAIASQSQSERSDEASGAVGSGSRSRSKSKSKSKDSSFISMSANNEDTDKTTNVRSTGSQSQSVQVSVSGRDIPEHVNVSSRSSRGKDNVRSSLQTQSKSHSVHQQNAEEPHRSAVSISDRIRRKSGSKSSSSVSVSAPVPVPIVAPTQPRTDHESDTDYDEIAPSVSRASSNLPTEDVVYDMDFDTDVQTSRSKSIQSRSVTLASKSRRSDQQPSQAPSVQVQPRKASASHKGSLPPSVVIDLDITSGKSDEGPSEENSLSFSLSLNAQGQQLQQKQDERQESQSVSVGPSKGYDNFEIDEQDGEVGDDIDIEDNLPSILSSIMAEEDLVSASIQLDQSLQVGLSDQEEEAELVDESIPEDFEPPSHSVGHVKSSQKELKSQDKAPGLLEQGNQELQEEEPEPNSKDTTAFDDKIDTNLSFSMPSGVYDFDDEFNTDVSNVQSDAGDAVEAIAKKPTEKTSVAAAVDLEQVEMESEAKDDTIIEEVEEEEDTEDGNVDAEEGSSIGVDAGARASTKAGHNQNEFEVADDSFLSEIPEDIVSSTKSNSISFVQDQNQLELVTLRNQQKISISSISEDSPPTSTTKTKGNKKGSQGEVETGVKQVYDIDISGKIVGEMDSILSDASNIPEDHHVPIGGSSHVAVEETEAPEKFEDLELDLDTEISEKSKSHSKKSQDISTQKSATTDFSQQANFIVTQEEAEDKNYIFNLEKQTEDTIHKSKSPSPVLKDLDDGVKADLEATNFNDAGPVQPTVLSPISTPLPAAAPVLADQSDEEISEIVEDLPSEGISQSRSLSKSEKEKSRHEDASSDKSMKSKSKSKTPELPEETPGIVPVSGNATARTTTATTWDAELSAKSPISVSHSEQQKGASSDLPVQIEVQAPPPQKNLQLQSQSPPPPQSPLEFQSHSQTSEISEDVPQTPDDASSSESEESQSRSRKGTIGERPVAEAEATSKETAGVVLSDEDIAVETETVEVEAKMPEPEQQNLETVDVSIQSVADPDSFLASIASQVSEILSKSSKSAAVSQKSERKPLSSRQKSEEDEAASEASLSKKSEAPVAVKSSVSSRSESPKLLPPEVKQEKDNSNLLDLAKTIDTDIIEKIESLIADEISKQMELEEKENDNEESQSTNSQATEIDADDSKFSAASYSNFHVEDVVYESDFDTDVQSQSEKSGKSEKSVAVSKSNSVSKSTNTKNNGAKSSGAGTKHSGLLEAVVKNEVELLVREQSERLKNATQDGEGDFIRNEHGAGTTDLVPSQIENEIPLNKTEKATNIEIASTAAASVTKPKLGVEARVRTIIENKETMDGLVTRIIARMLKEVSLARSVAFKGLTSTSLSLANTKLSLEDVPSGFGSSKDGSTSTRMMQVPEEDDNDDNSVSTHEEVDVDGDAEWFEDDIISGGNTAEDESLKREAAEIVAEQMRIENEIRALEALQAQVPATLMNLSDVPDKPPPPYSPPSSDSASLGLRSFAIQYTQKQLQDLIHNQVDRIWDEWSSTKKFPIYEYIDDSEDFPLKSLPLFLDESSKENEPSGGDTTQTMTTTNNKKEKESSKENESLPIPVLSTRAFNTLLFDLIKDTMKDILLIEDDKCSSSSSIGKDYVDRIRPGSLSIEAQKMRIPKTKDGLFRMIYMRVKNLLPYPLLTNDVPVPRRRLTKWTSRPRDLVDEVLAEELIDEDREWTESWPEEILVIDRWSEKFSRRAVREVMGAFKAVFTTTTSV